MGRRSYDVAVIGAGPAGSSAAHEPAKHGLSVIIIDRRKQVGIPVQCGELVPAPSEVHDLFPKSVRLPKLVNIPKEFITNQTSIMRLVSPGGQKYEFPFQTNIVDRRRYDNYLVMRAVDSGAELRLSSLLTKRTQSNRLDIRSKGETYRLDASVVVGADGPSSVISKSIGNRYSEPERDLSPSLNYVMSGVECDPNAVEMYFGRSIAPGGFCWIIPKGDRRANVGLGIRRRMANSNVPLRRYLQNFIKHNPVASPLLAHGKVESRIGAIIPMAGPVSRTHSSKVLLVGDAAGHVMASNGGGIPTALCGGDIAGEIIVKHFKEGMPLGKYTSEWKREIGHELGSALDVLRVADQVMLSDAITEVCMQLAGSRFLEPLIRCRLPLPVEFISKTAVRLFNML